MIPPTVPPLPDASSSPDSAHAPFGTPVFRFKVLIAFVLLFGFILYNNVFVKDSADTIAKNDRAKLYVDALTDTKEVYALQNYHRTYELEQQNSKKRSTALEKDIQDVIKQWKKLAESPRASANDWRRLGIVQYAFDDAKGGAKSLSRAAELSTKPRTKKERDEFETPPYPETESDPKYEREHWELIYGKRPLNPMDAQKLRQFVVAKYRLGWFNHLVAEQTYRKMGRTLDAAAEKAAALKSCHQINLTNNLRLMLIVWGFFALIYYGVKALVKQFQRNEPHSDVTNIPALPILPNTFSYRARVIAFLSYLIVPVAVIIPLGIVRGFLSSTSAVNLMRMLTILYLVFSFATVGFALWILKHLQHGEEERGGILYAKSVWQRIGLGSKEPVLDVVRGVHGYGMAMVVMLVGAGISHVLFSRFKTPSHPIVYELLVMQTFGDRILLFLQVAVAAAITEEIMFRGVLYPAFRERFGVVGGITLTSALFALAHPTLPGGFLPLMALGAAFNIAYEKRGSLIPGITMHALNNGLLILAEFAVMAS